ncbi:hypothetical protein G7Y89_g5698 [Cudoniella acicularis]|uniref:NACHT domain-containing protein n=1 Tax=Cudoniella acicularis TaxID=354080 RepID=A0A8H4RMT5_9HELO|nr:hypothetical protein G7Y89_g5698 [Cudoniella acicularis]
MEALAVLGVASNILQVIDFSSKLVIAATEIHKARTTLQHADLQSAATDLKSLNSKLTTSLNSSGALTEENTELHQLANESILIADELVLLLDSVNAGPNPGRLESFRKATKTAWKRNKIEASAKRLESIREQIQFRILVQIKTELDFSSFRDDAQWRLFDNNTKKIMETIIANGISLQAKIDHQTASLSLRHDHHEETAVQRHEEVLTTIQDKPVLSSVFIPSRQTNRWDMEPDPRNVQRKILNLLDFRQRRDRHEDIAEAHKKTFEWLYQHAECYNKPWDNFLEWLQNGTGIYWVNGKAGSGKSTLMKFVDDEVRTHQVLDIWAERNGLPVVKASYYFWNTGTAMQKSRKGLLQSLLYQILSRQPQLVSVTFSSAFDNEDFDFGDFPSYSEVKRAFNLALRESGEKMNLFLLIDGLDEYDADGSEMSELAEYFQTISNISGVKLLLSSRPLPTFEEAFKQNAQLRLQDLTAADITAFVEDKITTHQRIQELTETD